MVKALQRAMIDDKNLVEVNTLPKTPQSNEIVTDSLSFTPSEVKILKELVQAIQELTKKK